MKSLLIIAMAIASVFQTKSSLRIACVEVESVNPESSLVTFVDSMDELWVAEVDEPSEYQVCEEFVLIYNDMGTESIYDDEIISIIEVEVAHGQK